MIDLSNKKNVLTKVGLGIAVMFGLYWIYSIFVQNHLNVEQMVKTLIGLVVLYVIGLALFRLIIRKIPNTSIEKRKVSVKTFVICFLLQFTAIIVLSVIANVVAQLSGQELSADINTLTPYMLFMLIIFNPIIEEFVFRKLFADKLLKFGELFYIIVSSFCFAIIHGVSLGIPQVVYTFILGLIWSYLYVKTGNLVIPIVFHSLSNIFGSIIIQTLQGISLEAVGIYSLGMIVLAISGVVCFLINKKKIRLDNENKLFSKTIVNDLFTNEGIIVYTVLTIGMIVLKNIL